MTDSMQKTIDQTNHRREKQLRYNEVHHITPKQIIREHGNVLLQSRSRQAAEAGAYIEDEHVSVAADPVVRYMNSDQLRKLIQDTRKNMEKAARSLDFIEAARLRDEMMELEVLLEKADSGSV
jgi:excinuclease ABC subunit B